MKGDFLHNHVLANCLVQDLQAGGCTVSIEHRVDPTPHPRHADLVTLIGDRVIVIELERSAARVRSDMAKADALGADTLLIVVPHSRLVRSVRNAVRKSRAASRRKTPRVLILTLGAARRWIAQQLGRLQTSISPTTSLPTPHPHPL